MCRRCNLIIGNLRQTKYRYETWRMCYHSQTCNACVKWIFIYSHSKLCTSSHHQERRSQLDKIRAIDNNYISSKDLHRITLSMHKLWRHRANRMVILTFFFFSFLSLSFPFLFFSVWTKRPIVSFSKLYEQLSSTLQLGPRCRSDTGRLYLSTTSTYGSNILPTTRTTAYATTTSYVQSTYTTEYSDIESGKKESIYIFPPILPTIIFTIKFYNIYNVNLNFSMIPLS